VEKFHWLSKDEFDEKSGDVQVIRRTILFMVIFRDPAISAVSIHHQPNAPLMINRSTTDPIGNSV
jgi:hypothetical protein